VSGWLLDVNVLLGCGWKSHADQSALLGWLLQVNDWATCPLTESGFMRISLTTAYRATFDDARKSLATLRALCGHRFPWLRLCCLFCRATKTPPMRTS
jgi:predicted nucleic acid-binding protein